MMSPNFIGAYSWILLLGRSGTVTQLLKGLGIHMPSIYGFGGMLLVFALKLYPFIYMYVSGALKKIDVALSEAAESLGCGGLKKVLTVIMPLVTPTLIAAAPVSYTHLPVRRIRAGGQYGVYRCERGRYPCSGRERIHPAGF